MSRLSLQPSLLSLGGRVSSLPCKCSSRSLALRSLCHLVPRLHALRLPLRLGVCAPQAGGVAAPAAQPAAVHALNILRALYRDSRLGDHVVSFIPEGIKLAIAGFSASLWPVS